MLKRLNDALPELVLGIILYGIAVELVGVWFVTDKLRYTTGLVIGIALAVGMAVNMAIVLRDAVDFVKLAEAMGALGIRAETRDEFREALREALSCGRPIVIDCQIDSDDKVWPMVAPGEAIEKAFTEEDLKKSES